jgi:hypothetical protein
MRTQPITMRVAVYVAGVLDAANYLLCTVLCLIPDDFAAIAPAVIPGTSWARQYMGDVYSRYRKAERTRRAA